MDIADVPDARRFTIPVSDSTKIQQHVAEKLGPLYHAMFPDDDQWEWSVVLAPLDDLTYDPSILPNDDAADIERDRAVAWTRLMVGEARPLVTMSRDHLVIDGVKKLDVLSDLGEDHAVAYHARRR